MKAAAQAELDAIRDLGDQARVVTIHVERRQPEKTGKKLSAPRPDLPPRFLGHGGDTPAFQSRPEAQGRAAAPAPRNLGAPEGGVNPGTKRAEAAAAKPPPESPEALREAADEALALAEADLARALDAAGPEAKAAAKAELDAIRDLGEEARVVSVHVEKRPPEKTGKKLSAPRPGPPTQF